MTRVDLYQLLDRLERQDAYITHLESNLRGLQAELEYLESENDRLRKKLYHLERSNPNETHLI